ncbi:hypothetical protein AgCh_002370 [Apium graveolens]
MELVEMLEKMGERLANSSRILNELPSKLARCDSTNCYKLHDDEHGMVHRAMNINEWFAKDKVVSIVNLFELVIVIGNRRGYACEVDFVCGGKWCGNYDISGHLIEAHPSILEWIVKLLFNEAKAEEECGTEGIGKEVASSKEFATSMNFCQKDPFFVLGNVGFKWELKGGTLVVENIGDISYEVCDMVLHIDAIYEDSAKAI